jgi:hypothetical protein
MSSDIVVLPATDVEVPK